VEKSFIEWFSLASNGPGIIFYTRKVKAVNISLSPDVSGFFSIMEENGPGLGSLTVYTGALLYYFAIPSGEGLLAKIFILVSIVPAYLVYEFTEEFTDPILEKLLEQHIAIARLKMDLQNEGNFEEWYSGENVARIDELDAKSRRELTTTICALLIGLSAPVSGWFSYQHVGLAVGLAVAILGVLVAFYALQQIVQAIERTPKVIQK
jgi:hypothetical protein